MKTRLAAVFVAGLSVSAGAQTPFPCEKLDQGTFRVFSGFASVAVAPSQAVKAKKGALIVRQDRALTVQWMKPEDGQGELIPYKSPQLVFGPYRIDGRIEFCASGRRDDVFGAGDTRQQFMLRCLVDHDGDEVYEAFHRRVELVRMDAAAQSSEPDNVLPQDRPLRRPFRLVSAPGATPPNAAFEPRLVSVVQIKDVRDDVLVLRLKSQVRALPGTADELLRAWGDEDVIELPLQDGLDATIKGVRITVARQGRDWIVAAPDGASAQGKLMCGGSVLDTGLSLTLFEAGGMALVRKAGVPTGQ